MSQLPDDLAFQLLWEQVCVSGANARAAIRSRRKDDVNHVHMFAVYGSARLNGEDMTYDRLMEQAELASAQTGRSVDSFLRHYDAAAFKLAELVAS